MDSNETLERLEIARRGLAKVEKYRRGCFIGGSFLVILLIAGVTLGVWSTFAHVNLGGSCAGVIALGLFGGGILLGTGIFLDVDVVESLSETLRVWGKMYNNALNHEAAGERK